MHAPFVYWIAVSLNLITIKRRPSSYKIDDRRCRK
jgi:hypothetical protein